MRARIVRTSIVVSAVAGAVLATAGAANANSFARTSGSEAACASETVCLYADPEFTGPYATIEAGSAAATFPPTFDNQMSVWVNNTTLTYCWWSGPNFTGEQFPMPPGAEMSLPPEQDDQASSAGPC